MKYLKKYNEDINWNWLDEEEAPIPEDFKDHEDFYNFLKDNNALEKWINNFKNIKWKKVNIKKFLDEHKGYYKSIINGSFTWSNTPEGYNFWGKIHDEWIKNK